MAYRYPECEFCNNHETDPFECDECEDGDNYEGADDVENLTYHEFISLLRKAA
jgi:hypothetical protein